MVGVFDARVMAGGDVVGVDRVGVFVELAELQPVVAAHAGVGRSALVVLIDEVVDDFAEVFFEVKHVKGDVEHGGDVTRIGGVVDRAAAFFVRFGLFGRVAGAVEHVVVALSGFFFVVGAEAHEAADHLVAALLEQRGGDGAIDAAGHGDDHFCGPIVRHSPAL